MGRPIRRGLGTRRLECQLDAFRYRLVSSASLISRRCARRNQRSSRRFAAVRRWPFRIVANRFEIISGGVCRRHVHAEAVPHGAARVPSRRTQRNRSLERQTPAAIGALRRPREGTTARSCLLQSCVPASRTGPPKKLDRSIARKLVSRLGFGAFSRPMIQRDGAMALTLNLAATSRGAAASRSRSLLPPVLDHRRPQHLRIRPPRSRPLRRRQCPRKLLHSPPVPELRRRLPARPPCLAPVPPTPSPSCLSSLESRPPIVRCDTGRRRGERLFVNPRCCSPT